MLLGSPLGLGRRSALRDRLKQLQEQAAPQAVITFCSQFVVSVPKGREAHPKACSPPPGKKATAGVPCQNEVAAPGPVFAWRCGWAGKPAGPDEMRRKSEPSRLPVIKIEEHVGTQSSHGAFCKGDAIPGPTFELLSCNPTACAQARQSWWVRKGMLILLSGPALPPCLLGLISTPRASSLKRIW